MMYAFNSINVTQKRNKHEDPLCNSINEDSFNEQSFTPNLAPVNTQLILKASSLSPIINNDSLVEPKNNKQGAVVLFMRKSSESEEESDVI